MKGLIIILLLASCNSPAQTTFAMLSGSGSENAASYHWEQISGESALLLTPDSTQCKVDSLTAGTRLFELTCTNQFGESRDSVMISVIVDSNSVIITSAVRRMTSLVWTVTPEKNLWYYLIQKTKDAGKTYSQVTKYLSKGLAKYTYWLSWTVYKYTYQVSPVFKDGSKGTTVIFK